MNKRPFVEHNSSKNTSNHQKQEPKPVQNQSLTAILDTKDFRMFQLLNR